MRQQPTGLDRRQRTTRWLAGWLIGVVAVGVGARVVALPEQCAPVTSGQRRSAVIETVGWFERTQAADGSFLYRLDATTGERLPGYSWVRHAGVLLALEQSRTAQVEGAGAVADKGWAALDDQITIWGDRAGVVDGDRVTAGGTALAVAALAERRSSTGLVDRDDLLRSFGRQLLSHVADDGTVAEIASAADGSPVAGSLGRFTTGEVSFALARLERVLPGEGWGEPVHRILHYLALHKAEREGFVPDMADHWGAYTLAEVVRWPNGGGLDPVERRWARKQMGMASVMIRYESQRSGDGLDRWLRGRTSVGSAVGTHGESMQGWATVAAADPALASLARGTRDRLACNAAVLVDRQVTAAQADELPDPDAARGTWLWFGVTQMDDQQHALSALLGAQRVLDDPEDADGDGGGGVLPRRSPTPESTWLAIAVVFLAVEPLRAARRVRSVRAPVMAGGAVLSTVVLVLLAAVGAAVLRLLDASVPTAAVASGLVLAVVGVVGLLTARRSMPGVVPLDGLRAALVPVAVPSLLRPAALLMALTLGAGGHGWAVAAGASMAVLLAGLLASRSSTDDSSPGAVWAWADHAMSIATVVVGVMLLVDGVYAV